MHCMCIVYQWLWDACYCRVGLSPEIFADKSLSSEEEVKCERTCAARQHNIRQEAPDLAV